MALAVPVDAREVSTVRVGRATPAIDLPARFVLIAIRGYQLTLSALIGGQCRFHPSCSAYAIVAIERFGALQGGWMALRRIGRCHPFNPGGVDPVPDRQPGAPEEGKLQLDRSDEC